MVSPAFSLDFSALTPDEQTLLSSFLEGFPSKDKSLLGKLSLHERDALLSLLDEVRGGLDTASNLSFDWLWELDYIEKPVSPETYLTDPYYYGKSFRGIFEGWVKEMIYVMDPANQIQEFNISGAIGTGKSTVAGIIQSYRTLYHLSLLKNPQRHYNLQDGSTICLGLFNTTLDKTDITLYNKLDFLLKSIPYFRDRFPIVNRNKFKGKVQEEKIILPRDIAIIQGSNSSHATSLDIFGVILDEQNFREGRRRPPYIETNAYKLYQACRKRMKARFPSNPGLLINISSSESKNDFLEEHLAQIDKEERDFVHTSSFAIWEIRPSEYANEPRFHVMVGDKTHSSRILEEKEEFPPGHVILEVPQSLHVDFKKDLDNAIRQLGGVSTEAGGRLIPVREKIAACSALGASQGLKHPWTVMDTALGLRSSFELKDLFIPNILLENVGRHRRLRRHPDSARHVHVDLALTGDSAGISMSHIAHSASVVRYDLESGKHFEIYLPVVEVDFMLRIRPPAGDQIDFTRILSFVWYLKDVLQIPIVTVTYDGFQSAHSIQILKKNNLEASKLSMDKDDDAYLMLRQCVLDGRLAIYPYGPFEEELGELVHDTKTRKVDHQKGKAKDVSDAVCGSVHGAICGRSIAGPSPGAAHDLLTSSWGMVGNQPVESWLTSDYKRPEGREIMHIGRRPT